MTLGEMEKSVRFMIGDQFETYRFSAGFVLTALCEGVERLREIRPESRYFGIRLFDWVRPTGLSIDAMDDSQVDAARAFEPYFDPRWNDAVAHFASYKCYEHDQSDTANAQLAADHMAKFKELALS